MISKFIFIVYQSYRSRILIAWRPQITPDVTHLDMHFSEFMEDIVALLQETKRQQA